MPATTSTPSAAPRVSRGAVLALTGAGVLAIGLAVGLLLLQGRLVAGPFDPGVIVRYGLPAARAAHDLAAAVSVGLLVLAAWCVAPDPEGDAGRLSGVRRHAVRMAGIAVIGWLGLGIVVLISTASDVSGFQPGSAGFGGVLISFVTQIDLGRALGFSLLVVIVVGNLILSATRVTTVAWAAVLSVAALLPLALGGHAAGTADHMNSVDSLALHLVGVCVWVGGLAGLMLISHRLQAQLPVVVARYSILAGWCFALVAISGLVNAALRLGSWSALAGAYGLLVIGKVAALGMLGTAGFLHRRFTIGRLSTAPRGFARLAIVELLIMGATLGLAVALSRSVPPATETPFDPLTVLLGYPAPAPISVGRYFAAFYPEVLWLAVALLVAGLYAKAVVRLHRRGDRWPAQRSVFWAAGCLALIFVTSGGPAVYGRLHFSTHMVQHMALMVIVPLLLVFGAPLTLAMRAIPARTDGSFGPREMLLRLVHARALRILGHPIVAVVLFTGSLSIFYYTRLFELAMFTHTGHVLMTAHFLATGYLFVWSLVGLDPGPARPPYPFRLVLLLMTLAFHAFFGIALMASNSLLAPDWWHALGQNDDVALLADQQTGGAIAWAAGDLPSLFLAVALLVGWVRSDASETRRLDRQADRDGDAALRRYNRQLADLSRRDEQ